MGMADLPTYNPTTKTQRILSTPDRPSGPLFEEKNTKLEYEESTDEDNNNTKEKIDKAIFKNIGFVNRKWTEIAVSDEVECEQLEREEVKKAIIQMSQRELYYPIDVWSNKCIRIKQKTYVPVDR